MVKKTLIAVAVVALLATTANAQVNPQKYDDSWPGHWVVDAQDICTMDVVMDVGMYVQLKDCHKKKIKLKQVDCPSGKKFPCYNDCETFDLRANFDVKLGTKLSKSGSVIKKWSAYFDGGDVYTADSGGWKGFKVCVEASESEIWTANPGDQVKVGTLTITVMPN